MLLNESFETKSQATSPAPIDTEPWSELASSPVSYLAPGHLQAVARLHGLTAAPLRKARVLELGCASGGNLVPFAIAHPWASVTGVDLSAPHIEAGLDIVHKLDIRNLELRHVDLCDLTEELGEFDYILCHNVFSVVRPEVRAAILRICQTSLSTEGVACVTYHTYPGWKVLDVVRDTLRLHTAGLPAHALQARLPQVLDFLEHSLADDNLLAGAMTGLIRELRQQPAGQILQDLTSAINTPCYFNEFCAALEEYRLSYIADALPQTDMPDAHGPVITSSLQTTLPRASRERRAQYLDIAVGRRLRRSVFTRRANARRPLKALDTGVWPALHYALWLTPTQAPSDVVASTKYYRTQAGNTVAIIDPVAVAAVETLRQAWPATLAYASVVDGVRRHLPQRTPASLAESLDRAFLTLLQLGVLHIRVEPLPYPDRPTLQPELIPGLANLLRHHDDTSPVIGYYNLWHQAVAPPRDPLLRLLLARIDGKHTHTALRSEVRKALYSGELNSPGDLPLAGRRNLNGKALELLLPALHELRRSGLII